jgi:hypothetical protein
VGDVERETVSDIHIIPVNDLMNYDEHRECWCCPVINLLTDGGACDVEVIHNALDGRKP